MPRSRFQPRLTPSVRRLWRGRKNQPSLQTGRSPDAAGRGKRAKRQKPWRDSPPRPPKPKVPEPVKRDVETRAHECMASVRKPKHLAPAPQDTDGHDLVDISTKWSRNSCSFCATDCRPGPSAIAPSFETQCARRESVGDQKFHGSSLRHTGQWGELSTACSVGEGCEALREEPHFLPESRPPLEPWRCSSGGASGAGDRALSRRDSLPVPAPNELRICVAPRRHTILG